MRAEHRVFSAWPPRGVVWPRGRHYFRRSRAQLVTECEAFLEGRLVESLKIRAESVPVWAWTNLLAHGSAPAIRAEGARTYRRWDGPDGDWQLARSFLATEVLYCAQLHGSLSDLQAAVLVPLELKLASSKDVATWGPGDWAATVERALPQQVGPRKQTNRLGEPPDGFAWIKRTSGPPEQPPVVA
ncbi:MAG TPA: hypothetical protein VEJ84_21795 [Acidimicrobiales bacterium]|nr:hypothetical protein [Acidimicrobiales bacterium]